MRNLNRITKIKRERYCRKWSFDSWRNTTIQTVRDRRWSWQFVQVVSPGPCCSFYFRVAVNNQSRDYRDWQHSGCRHWKYETGWEYVLSSRRIRTSGRAWLGLVGLIAIMGILRAITIIPNYFSYFLYFQHILANTVSLSSNYFFRLSSTHFHRILLSWHVFVMRITFFSLCSISFPFLL